ncbi:class I SAM-dependent methyltransferase [Natronobacterium texcoconense]|uniref:Ubiquinone/menaquinone biosynthesis C-methylase UbiE n=1 Tax=Natronobacterium texcoconense TaxID=1095778 RepID=A0A1H1AC51_NATTX|nr:class I SAM-dependent methyltransferase [Natronobacterium texcoconense]SDQ37204.1 Ubiquinone/menaquinone biosynthesis C-methylase UbiE [Natronobacterium texcoconense]
MDDDQRSITRHYDELASNWEAITRGPTKERILFPAIDSLLPSLSGKRVLDAGCGDGYYASLLADRGGDVLGIDASQEMVRVARDRYGDDVEFRRADLSEPLPAIEDDSVDVVLCQHVFSHLLSLETPLSEFARVLRPGGTLVVSTHHPFHDFLIVRDREYPNTTDALEMDLDPHVVADREKPAYHETERFEVHWGGPDSENPGTYYRRPLHALLDPLLAAGFDLSELVEPEPTEEFQRDYPDLARELRHRPSRSVCLRAER